jgi:hypothetical protein
MGADLAKYQFGEGICGMLYGFPRREQIKEHAQ